MSEAGENRIPVSGSLTMETTAALFNKGLPLKEGMSDLTIDMARVEAVDSSAVSLMLAWLRAAQIKKVKLSYVNVPDNLRSLARLYDVADSLSLPVGAAASENISSL